MRFELDFPVILKDYQSPNIEPSWIARSFPSLHFYTTVLGTVFRSARLAKNGRYKDPNWCLSSYEILKGLERVGTSVNIENIDSVLNHNGPAIIIGNHMSTLETFLLPFLICPHQKVTFVIKEALVSYPIFKHIMISRNPIVVGRTSPKQDFITVLTEGVKRVESGYSVIVFPQTTRMLQFDKTQFNTIGIKLAKRANVPIIPLALKTDCWGNGKLLKDFGKIRPEKNIHFRFGNPMRVEQNGKKQHEFVIEHIENCLNEWKGESESF